MNALYRCFNSKGRLLYVGISISAARRLSDHEKKKSWFSQICRIEVERFRSREKALAAERKAIKTEKPIHNIILQPTTETIVVKSHDLMIPKRGDLTRFFIACGSVGGKMSAAALGKQGLSARAKRGWQTRKSRKAARRER